MYVCVCEGGGGSPVTKLAVEACDVFKGMPKKQHLNKLRYKMTYLHTETSHCGHG